ncbi:site-specific integrase [soil metagenome]
MAWIVDRYRTDDSPYWTVRWREGGRDSKVQSISWNDYADAEHCKQLVEKVGGDKAREIMRIVQAPRHAQTVEQFLLKHIDHLTGVEEGTVKKYRAYVRNDIADTIGQIPLTALTRDDIALWINEMAADGASGKTVKNKRDFVSGALKLGLTDPHCPLTTNPCEGVKSPTWVRLEMVFLERDEFQLLLAAVTDYWKPLVEFLVASGCRWSEAAALRPADIDLRNGTVRISKAWKSGDAGFTIGSTKTKKSVRTINVPKRVLDQLDLTGEWVFTNSGRGSGLFSTGLVADDSRPVRAHNFNPKVWAPAVARAQAEGLTKKPRVHDLRHTCASWLINAGRPLTAVQAQLGHESIQTTSDVYGHLDRSSGQGNADAIDAMLSFS